MTKSKLTYQSSLILVSFFLINPAQSAENAILTDLRKELTNKLASKPGVRKSKFIESKEYICHPGPGRKIPCGTPAERMTYPIVPMHAGMDGTIPMCYEPRCTEGIQKKEIVVVEPLLATSGKVVKVNQMQVLDAQTLQFPPKTFIKQVEKINCSKTEKSKISESFAFSSQASVSTQVRRGVSSSVGVNARIDFKLPSGFGASLGGSVSQTTSLDRTETQTSNTTINYGSQISEDVPPLTRTRVELFLYETSLEVPFHGSVVADGDLDANMDGKKLANQVLNEAERSIDVEGILAVTASTMSTSRRTDYPVTSLECESVANGTLPAYAIRDLDYVGQGFNTLSTTRQEVIVGSMKSGVHSKNVKTVLRYAPFATSGSLCYMGNCETPLNGYREICYGDDDGGCSVCSSEPDAACEPMREPESGDAPKR